MLQKGDLNVSKFTQFRTWKRRARTQTPLEAEEVFAGTDCFLNTTIPEDGKAKKIKRKAGSNQPSRKKGRTILHLEDELTTDMADGGFQPYQFKFK